MFFVSACQPASQASVVPARLPPAGEACADAGDVELRVEYVAAKGGFVTMVLVAPGIGLREKVQRVAGPMSCTSHTEAGTLYWSCTEDLVVSYGEVTVEGGRWLVFREGSGAPSIPLPGMKSEVQAPPEPQESKRVAFPCGGRAVFQPKDIDDHGE